MALGIIFMIAGVIALGSVVMATVSAIYVIGIMMIMAGVTEIITAFTVKEWGRFVLWMLLGLLYVAAGVICFSNPFEAATIFTLMLGIALMIGGVVRGFLAWSVREAGKPWGWVGVSALITLLLGLIIVAKWPYSSAYTLGIFLGIDLIFIGSSWLGHRARPQEAGRLSRRRRPRGRRGVARPGVPPAPFPGRVRPRHRARPAGRADHRTSSSGPAALFSDQASRRRLRSQKMQARVSGGYCTTFLSVRSCAVMQHRALDRAAVADRALVEAARHPRVGHDPALAHRLGEGGMARDPVVDGARRDVEEARQLRVGGAQQAVVVGELAEFAAVGGGTAGGGHN